MDEFAFEPITAEGSIGLVVMASILVIFILVLLIFGIWWLKRRLTRPEMYGLTREQVKARWIEVRQTGKQNIMGAKLAIMEADALLDSSLKSLMMPGTTLGERLKVACYKYPGLRNVWWAHKIRNQLAHETSFQISMSQAKNALDEFEKALKILNVL